MTKKGAQILITIQEMIYPAKNVELLSALFPVDALRRNARSKYADESAQAIINSMATHSVGYKTTISGPIAMAIYRYANATYRKQLERKKDVSPQLITLLRRRGQMGRFTFARRRRRIYGAEIEPYPRAIDDGNPETLTVVSITNESEQEHSCEAGCLMQRELPQHWRPHRAMEVWRKPFSCAYAGDARRYGICTGIRGYMQPA